MGWAKQPGLTTVQSELERALGTVLRQPVDLAVAGRTDRGVHAWAQVCSYEGPPPPRLRAINALLPQSVVVLSVERAPDGFDARRHALSRTYCYRMLVREQRDVFEHGRALWWPHTVDRLALEACADAIKGTHDFTAFTPAQTDHVRFERIVMKATWAQRGGVYEFWVEADAFMRNMIRVLVGTMLEVAGGRRSSADFRRLLDGATRSDAGPTAPAHGLFFAGAKYDPPAFTA